MVILIQPAILQNPRKDIRLGVRRAQPALRLLGPYPGHGNRIGGAARYPHSDLSSGETRPTGLCGFRLRCILATEIGSGARRRAQPA